MDFAYKLANLYLSWADPWLCLTASALVFFLLLIPKKNDKQQQEDKTGFEFRAKIYNLILFSLLSVSLFAPLACAAMLYLSSPTGAESAAEFLSIVALELFEYPEIPILALLVGVGIPFTFNRFVIPRFSAFKRRWRVRQTGETPTDIRNEKGRFTQKRYKPSDYYKPGYFFWGLDENNEPIYDLMSVWLSRHFRYVGPTQTGKGVEIGVALDQVIRAGVCTWFIDPKPDKHAKKIMLKACKESGRRFVELDLRGGKKGAYEPFSGGEIRHAMDRLIYFLGLRDTGEQADFYKSIERSIITKALDMWDRKLSSLEDILTEDAFREHTTRSVNYISQMLSISTFNPEGERTFSVARALRENAVVYIRGDLDDDIINMATTLLIMEFTQEVKRLYEDGSKKTNVTAIVDEIAFLINEKIADALATIAGFDANMGLAYQSEGDLENLKDKTLNAKAISNRVRTNCKNSLYYMAVDAETAQRMEDEGGTIQKFVTRAERVDTGAFQEETFTGNRDLHNLEEGLITRNTAKMLPETVGVLYRPNQLAAICHTSWIDVTEEDEAPPAPKDQGSLEATEAEKKAPSIAPADEPKNEPLKDNGDGVIEDSAREVAGTIKDEFSGNELNRSVGTKPKREGVVVKIDDF